MEYMNEKFFDLKKEKQDRMINAALKIFAEHGFKHASTDDIVKEAGISKGLLFHYFISKSGLYEFLFDYSAKYMMLELSGLAQSKEDDYFAIYRQIIYIRSQVMKNYPYMQLFLTGTVHEDERELTVDLMEKMAEYQEFQVSFFEKANLSYFKEEKDAVKIMCLVDYAVQGLLDKSCKEGTLDPDGYYTEIEGFLTLMRKLSYKA